MISKCGFFTVPNGEFLTILFSKNFQNVVIFKSFGQGGRKQIFYGGARLNRKKNFHPESEKFWNFYYINPKKMGGPVPPRPPSSVHPGLHIFHYIHVSFALSSTWMFAIISTFSFTFILRFTSSSTSSSTRIWSLQLFLHIFLYNRFKLDMELHSKLGMEAWILLADLGQVTLISFNRLSTEIYVAFFWISSFSFAVSDFQAWFQK